MTYIAHIRKSDDKQQTVEEHLLGVKDLAEEFGYSLNIKHITGLAGILHDMGKYSNAFREYILEAVRNPDSPPKRGSVDHSTAGGRLLYNLFHTSKIDPAKGILAEVVGNAVISHHAYLQDFLNPELESDYLRRVRDKDLDEFEVSERLFFNHVIGEEEFHRYVDQAAAELVTFRNKPSTLNSEAKIMFLTKFVFSALIDADRTNTRRFEENGIQEPEEPDRQDLFNTYYIRLLDEVNALTERSTNHSLINVLRSRMSEQCDGFADRPSGIYTLSIPTGGGKTLASLRYALKHAINHNKQRIIYVLPYTTIIEQNAAEVRRILQDEVHILEHHSNVIEDTDDDERMDGVLNVRQKLKLAKDNWESRIIFTTMVQFLNVFYAKGSRNIRRLHHLSESVIIFDEVQKVPVSCVSLFNEALNFLSAYGQSSMVLCTATQPALDFVEHKLNINPDAEMIDQLDEVIAAFKRVEIRDLATDNLFNNDRLTDFVNEKMKDTKSVLVILNTKTVVRKLYEQLVLTVGDIPVYHLSTSMCAAHRKRKLGEIRLHLSNGDPIVCVSTPLIEAGVDVSFECVIRSLAGLDSIAQAAGRCNRHGEREVQQVYVIDHEEENLNHLKEVKSGKQISKRILIDLKRNSSSHGGNILSVKAMERYFHEFYTELASSLNYSIPKLRVEMTSLLTASKSENDYYQAYSRNKSQRLPLFIANSYHTAAEHFQVIDHIATSVLVPYGDEGKEIIASLNGAERIEDFSRLLRRAQQYTINIFDYELQKLLKNDGIERILDGQILVLKEGAYSEEFGLNDENDSWLGMNLF
ncbi:CRISPR-associated helicase Cas3' [Paenibacillus chibensis]|uniref:CRISPR-associated helicase Cas3' n=1 Tax=Paenibacillus chibensis TaxID=59846 RepID=UPI000FD71668|nr:CRISPR-associated helicase Cas3' [Paenibacillus chibensis]MEC0370667.1 CRISPR-associated helicase Cas3' [Paenibacillus chibensis]